MTLAPQVSRVLVSSSIPGLGAALRNCLPMVDFQETDLRKEQNRSLSSSEVMVADPDHLGPLMYAAKGQIAFVQGTWAGLDAITRHLDRSKPLPTVTLCRLAHPSFSKLMAEYCLGQVICAERKFHSLRQSQNEENWDTQTGGEYRGVEELTVGILGMGVIGKMTAKLFKDLGSRVLGLVRTCPSPSGRSPHVDEYFEFSQIVPLLGQCDYICNILPHTEQTTNILGGSVLESCKDKKPTLVNVGRASIISDDDLLHALDQEWLGQVILDVFWKEPLSKGHPLWRHPKVLITPHCAAMSRPKAVAECFAENLRRYEAGENLNHVFDWERGY